MPPKGSSSSRSQIATVLSGRTVSGHSQRFVDHPGRSIPSLIRPSRRPQRPDWLRSGHSRCPSVLQGTAKRERPPTEAGGHRCVRWSRELVVRRGNDGGGLRVSGDPDPLTTGREITDANNLCQFHTSGPPQGRRPTYPAFWGTPNCLGPLMSWPTLSSSLTSSVHIRPDPKGSVRSGQVHGGLTFPFLAWIHRPT